jgi:uncharacterized protein YukE/predicted double-glycine peptidase
MTTIHLHPENARAVARLLAQNAILAQTEAQTLRNRIQQLAYAWQGGVADEFQAEAQELSRRLEFQAGMLEALAQRFSRELLEWESVDQSGAAVFRAGTPGIWGGSLPTAAGGWIPSIALPIAVSSWVDDLPPWLKNWLDKLFPPSQGQDDISQEVTGKTRLGELLEQSPIEQQDTPATPAQEDIAANLPATSHAADSAYKAYYDVPVKSQGALFGAAACAPTSISMVLDYFHNQDSSHATASPEALIQMLDPGDGREGKGISLHLMNDDLGELGYHNITVKAEASLEELTSHLNDGPVIITAGVKLIGGQNRDIQQAGNTVHAMVVKALNADSVVLNDPWSGAEKTFSREIFDQMWKNGQNGIYAIRP